MSILNLKIIFVEKQKRTGKRPTQGRGATFVITEMAVFTLETDYSRETGYPFDEIVFYFWMNNPPDFIRQFRRTIWRRDCPFQMASVQPPPPLWKNRRSGCQWGGRDCTQASLRRISISSSSVKTANNKIPESSVFNDSEAKDCTERLKLQKA